MLRRSTNELSIKPKMSESAKLAIVVISGLLLVAALYFTYNKGVHSGHQQYEQDRAVIAQLNQTIQGLRGDLTKAEETKIFAQRQQQIQVEAYKQMSNAYAASEQKNQYLGSRLDFYRSIISPEDGQSGPSIQGFDYRIEQDAINFDVTLVQAIKHKNQVRGSLMLQLFDGDDLVGQWPETNSRSISYQYFQQVSGSFSVGQLPQNARIKAKLSLRDGNSIERWFDIKAVK